MLFATNSSNGIGATSVAVLDTGKRTYLTHTYIHSVSHAYLLLLLLLLLQSFQELTVITVFGVLALYVAIAAIVYDGTVQYLYPHPSSPQIESDTAAVADRIPLFVPQTVLTFLGFRYYYCCCCYYIIIIGGSGSSSSIVVSV